MVRFALKDLLRGMTLASIGFGMLAFAFHHDDSGPLRAISLGTAFLIAFGGMFVGYGLAFWVKWPPHQMMFAMVGMFAAQAWQSGSAVGLIVYLVFGAVFGLVRLILGQRQGGRTAPGDAGDRQ